MTKVMSVKSLQTLENRSAEIGSYGLNLTDGLYWHTTGCYRHRDGRHYIREFGGPAVYVDNQPRWISREEAVEFVATLATDNVTGYGFTREQAEIMVDGGDAGKGYRGQ